MTKRLRATVIVSSPQGILLTETHSGLILLPGGGIERRELAIAAAVRELHEETGLVAEAVQFVCETQSHSNIHHVFEVRAFTGTPSALSDAKALCYQSTADTLAGKFPAKASPATVVIIKTYYDWLLSSGRASI